MVYDEYYYDLKMAKVQLSPNGNLGGMLQLGLTEKLIISTGHYSEEFH